MNKFWAACWVGALFVVVTHWTAQYPAAHEPELYAYVVANFEADCGTTNAVTAILLNYRMYDTMFEVLILLTAIVGMKQFLPARSEFRAKEPAGPAPGTEA